MKARIARTIVGVTALIIVILGVPFAIVIQRFYDSRATVELQRTAAETIAELTLPLEVAQMAAAAAEPDAPRDFSVYDQAGRKIYGSGPERVDATDPDRLVVISPITERDSETVVGSVRVSRAKADIAAQARRAWALMALAAVGGLAVAMLVARREAARLTTPIDDLVSRASRIGSGEPDRAAEPTGIAELDTLAAALTISSRRLDELVARERHFSANASHQLRTPLAGLRLSLERGDVATAIAEAERLAATIDHMLALARDALPAPSTIEIGPIVDAMSLRWQPAYRNAGRSLITTTGASLPGIRARPASIEQAVDILLDNSLRHGDGTTRLVARTAPRGLVIQVDDDGPGIDPDDLESIFDRHHGTDTGIGLTLARTLVEADGGRLMLADPEHAEFHIVFAGSPLRE